LIASAKLFPARTDESERPSGPWWRWLQKLPQHCEYSLKISIVLPNLSLQRFDLPRELFVGGEELTQVDECPHHLDARADRNGAHKNVGQHHHPVLGEDVRQVLDVLTPL
jgi:hypothetical protein